MVSRSKKRSAASEVLQKPEVYSKVVLHMSDASAPVPDRDIKAKRPVHLTRAKAASIRRAIAMKAPATVKARVAMKEPVAEREPVAVKRERAVRAQNVIGNLFFMTGKLSGKTGVLFGKIKNLVKEN